MTKKEYQEQAKANLESFNGFRDFEKRRKVLRKLCEGFQKHGLKWALAWSGSLFFKGVVDDFHDFDVIIETLPKDKMYQVLEDMGIKIETEYNDPCFTTKVFMKATLDGVDLDIMSDFGMKINDIDYHLIFDIKDIDYTRSGDLCVPVYCCEIQLLLYAILEDSWQERRRYKRILIFEYLQNCGLKHADIVDNALDMQFPNWIKEEIKKLKE